MVSGQAGVSGGHAWHSFLRPGHFELRPRHLLLSSSSFISSPLQCQRRDLEFLLNHHSVLSLAKKSEHLAQRFPGAKYFFLQRWLNMAQSWAG